MKACAAQRAEAIEAAGARASADRAAALAGLAQSVIGAATVQKLVADARARLRAAVTADVATFAQNPDDALAAEVSGTQLAARAALGVRAADVARMEADSAGESVGTATASAADFAERALRNAVAQSLGGGGERLTGHADFVEQARKRSEARIKTQTAHDLDSKRSEIADAHEAGFAAALPAAQAALDAYVAAELAKAMATYAAGAATAKREAEELAAARAAVEAERVAAEAAAAEADAAAARDLDAAVEADFAAATAAARAQCVQTLEAARARIATTRRTLFGEVESAARGDIASGVAACVTEVMGQYVTIATEHDSELVRATAEASAAVAEAMGGAHGELSLFTVTFYANRDHNLTRSP